MEFYICNRFWDILGSAVLSQVLYLKAFRVVLDGLKTGCCIFNTGLFGGQPPPGVKKRLKSSCGVKKGVVDLRPRFRKSDNILG